MTIKTAQQSALNFVNDHARLRKNKAQEKLKHILAMTNVSESDFNKSLNTFKSNTCIALHFHPDRLNEDYKSVIESLLETGIYKSQFETFISNGLVSPHLGGDRDQWEAKLFGNSYGASVLGRPKYGSLKVFSNWDGPSPRFGSCYFILNPETSRHCTFTYLDSHHSPDERGTYDEFDDILAALLAEIFTRSSALGNNNITVSQLIQAFSTARVNATLIDLTTDPSRNLDHYIEAQVHAEVSLSKDVSTLVADPSFKGTMIETMMTTLCDKNKIKLIWHPGFVLPTSDVPSNFRGPTMPTLAQRISTNGFFTAAHIGAAAASVKRNPSAWVDRGPAADVLKELKLLWHVLLKFGKQPKGS